jgi:hypothetical protein
LAKQEYAVSFSAAVTITVEAEDEGEARSLAIELAQEQASHYDYEPLNPIIDGLTIHAHDIIGVDT